MKTIVFTAAAARALRKLPQPAVRDLRAKLDRYAATGVGDVKVLSGRSGRRIRAGNYRVIFTETPNSIDVLAVGDRRDIYE